MNFYIDALSACGCNVVVGLSIAVIDLARGIGTRLRFDLLVRIGTAGWSIPARYSERLPIGGSHLERYARQMDAVEINTSFYRPHQRKTYERWARSTPENFLFSVKMPKAITHEARLQNCEAVLDHFLTEASGLGDKLGALLVQLPPTFGFDEGTAGRFFQDLRSQVSCPIVLEPRHPNWFTANIDKWLADLRVSRAATDPATVSGADIPGGWDGFAYFRWHGSPRIYYSDYDGAALKHLSTEARRSAGRSVPTWCIFDNTAAGCALGNALDLTSSLR
ncbi:DUF72 domain-containing protein [Bradyrhizobium sp.]|uniref:DUF72 domain-containing protein n=1 Tax=Bradyrhizobium sp. TaxID=376 RepID=UPI0039E3FDE3